MLIWLVSERIPDTWRIKGEEASWPPVSLPPSQVYGYTKKRCLADTHGRCVWGQKKRLADRIHSVVATI